MNDNTTSLEVVGIGKVRSPQQLIVELIASASACVRHRNRTGTSNLCVENLSHGQQRFEVRDRTKRLHKTRPSLPQTPNLRRQRRLDRSHLRFQRRRRDRRCRPSLPLSHPSSSPVGDISHHGSPSLSSIGLYQLYIIFHSILTPYCNLQNYAQRCILS